MVSCQMSRSLFKVLFLFALTLQIAPASPSTSLPDTAEPGTRATDKESTDLNVTESDLTNGTQAATTVLSDPPTTTDTNIASESTTQSQSPHSTPGATDSPTTTEVPEVTERNVTTPNGEDKSRGKDQIFDYDYYSLRLWGLICALLLCIMGLLVLLSGRCRGGSCRRRQKRKYNISAL
ncbi:uncharacterized protein PAF06_016764 [Gastrophryne carolinensis]